MRDLPLGPGPVATVSVAWWRVPVLVVVVVLVDLADLLRDDLVVDLRVVDDPGPTGLTGADGSGSGVPGNVTLFINDSGLMVQASMCVLNPGPLPIKLQSSD